LPYVHLLALLLLSDLCRLEMKRGRYRHPPTQRRHVGNLCRIHVSKRHAHLRVSHILVHRVLGHQGLSRLLLVLQGLEPLLLHLLLEGRVICIWEEGQLAPRRMKWAKHIHIWFICE
jgi:hypothetical protein